MPNYLQGDKHPRNLPPVYLTTDQIDSVKKAIYDLSQILNDFDEYYDTYGSYPSTIRIETRNTYDDE